MKAALWMSGAIVSFTAMAVSGREVSFALDTFEIMTYRSVIGLLLVLIIGSWAGTIKQINCNRFQLHFMRNIAHFTGQNLWFYAVTLIPFAQLFAFEFSVPIWVMLAAPFLLGERLTSIRILSITVGFLGILIVTRPWLAGACSGHYTRRVVRDMLCRHYNFHQATYENRQHYLYYVLAYINAVNIWSNMRWN